MYFIVFNDAVLISDVIYYHITYNECTIRKILGLIVTEIM
jgi:hypothetical protein